MSIVDPFKAHVHLYMNIKSMLLYFNFHLKKCVRVCMRACLCACVCVYVVLMEARCKQANTDAGY